MKLQQLQEARHISSLYPREVRDMYAAIYAKDKSLQSWDVGNIYMHNITPSPQSQSDPDEIQVSVFIDTLDVDEAREILTNYLKDANLPHTTIRVFPADEHDNDTQATVIYKR